MESFANHSRAVIPMKTSRVLLGLIGLASCAATQAQAWWGRDDGYVNKSYTTTTIVVRPYNAFSDMSCNLIANGMVPMSLLSGCMNGGCNSGRPACPAPYPSCAYGWPPRYVPYGEQAYYPAMYYPPVQYYPPPPPPPQPHGHQGPPPYGYAPPPGYGPSPPCPPGYGPGGY